MLDPHVILIDSVAQQMKAIAEHRGLPWDVKVDAAVRHEATRTLASGATAHHAQGVAAGIPAWASTLLKELLAALLAGLKS